MNYKESLKFAMESLASDHDYTFIGQGAEFGGHGMAPSIDDISLDNRLEMPVFEETQTGIALGMALSGLNIVSMYPRFDFFISGASQLINHSDKINHMSKGQFKPNLFFRVGVGSKIPLDAGPQHTNDYTKEFKSMLTDIQVLNLDNSVLPHTIILDAAEKGGIYLTVEHYALYGE